MIVKCNNCNKQLNKPPSCIKRNRYNFCSKKCSSEFRRSDLIGKKFGSLEVLGFDCSIKRSSGGTYLKYKCKCDCGKIISIEPGKIKSNPLYCRYCVGRKYVGEISSKYFKDLINNAKKRNILVEITQTDIWKNFLEQNRKCSYSGLELNWQDGRKGKLGTASVDRIINNKGYIKDNIQIIHKDINSMKLDHNENYFLYMCAKIANFNRNFTPILDYKPRKRGNRWLGFGEISNSYWGKIKEGCIRGKNRAIEFTITKEYAWDLYLQQGGVCALSGTPIIFEPSQKRKGEKTASLDRINSTFGYIEGNIQWVHKDVNRMKWDLQQNYFIILCQQITKYKGKNARS